MEQTRKLDLNQLDNEAAEDLARALETSDGTESRWTDQFAASGKPGKNP